MKKVHIQFQDLWGYWYDRTTHHEPTAFKEASNRANLLGKDIGW